MSGERRNLPAVVEASAPIKGTSLRGALAVPAGDWTDNAIRLGKALRRGYKRWLSE